MEIFKIQLPIATSAPVPLALVYNEDRSKHGQFEAGEDLIDLMDGRPKAFFFAKQRPTGEIEIDREAPWQKW